MKTINRAANSWPIVVLVIVVLLALWGIWRLPLPVDTDLFQPVVSPVALPAAGVIPQSTPNSQPEEKIRAVLEECGGQFALVTLPLQGRGPIIRINAEEVFPAASTVKPAIAALALQAALAGELPLEEVKQLAERAIAVSDNDTANQLIQLVGIERLNRGFQELGLEQTKIDHLFNQNGKGLNTTSAADLARFLALVEKRSLLNQPEIAKSIYQWMLAQQRRGKIPRDLPPEAIIANKTGETYSRILEHDLAIVSGPGFKFVLVVLIRDAHNNQAAQDAIAKTARLIWDEYLSCN